MKPEINPVEVFSGNIEEAEFIKSLLENAEIQVFIKDEFVGTLFPWVAAPGGAGSVSIIVSSEDIDRASIIMDDYNKNKKL